jgi:hypothetical protein
LPGPAATAGFEFGKMRNAASYRGWGQKTHRERLGRVRVHQRLGVQGLVDYTGVPLAPDNTVPKMQGLMGIACELNGHIGPMRHE